MIQLLISYDGGCNYYVVNKDASTEDVASMYDTLLDIMINDYNQHHYWSLDESYILNAVNVIDSEDIDSEDIDSEDIDSVEIDFKDVAMYVNRCCYVSQNSFFYKFIDDLENTYCKKTLISILWYLNNNYPDYGEYDLKEYNFLLTRIHTIF